MTTKILRNLSAAAAVLFASSVFSPGHAGPVEDGYAAYQRGDYATAMGIFRPLAEKGNYYAQVTLGFMYDMGRGVPQDYAEAARWHRRAADAGYATAQYMMGVSYAAGRGVPQDYAEAARWYRLAAAQGNPDAQNNLGVMYAKGQGVPQDYAEAARWYRRAADAGHAQAQYNLGVSYAAGQGVPQDYVQAHKWYNLAAANWPASEKEDRDLAVKNRDKIAARMTQVQIAEAQRLAREWKPRVEVVAINPMASPTPPENKELVAEAQRHLAKLGFDPGPPDGVIGPRTRSAVEQYQLTQRLQPDGLVTDQLVRLMRQQVAEEPRGGKPILNLVSSGTGFFVSAEGHVLTNEHVVKGCSEVRTHVPPSNPGSLTLYEFEATFFPPATVLRVSASDDLAILKTGARPSAVATFRQGSPPRLGEAVVVFGFPLTGALASAGNLTTGNITALAGLRDDSRKYQVSAPVQPGNSGGAVLDMNGDVVGVVESKLNAVAVAAAIGDIPQNVNFAVKGTVALNFMAAAGVRPQTGAGRRLRDVADVAALAQGFTVQVQCLK